MFVNFSSLEKIDLSNSKTDKVTKMKNLFTEYPSLKDLKISIFKII